MPSIGKHPINVYMNEINSDSGVLLNRRSSLPLTAINTSPYQWLYNSIIEISTIGYIIEMLGNVIKTLKIPPTITVSVCYYIS